MLLMTNRPNLGRLWAATQQCTVCAFLAKINPINYDHRGLETGDWGFGKVKIRTKVSKRAGLIHGFVLIFIRGIP